MAQENQDLRTRNGMLLIENEDTKAKLKELQTKIETGLLGSNDESAETQDESQKQFVRPQTASVYGRKKEEKLITDEDLNLA